MLLKWKEGRYRLDMRKKFLEGGEAPEQVVHRSCGCPISRRVQGQARLPGQPGLARGVHAYGSGGGTGGSVGPF